MSQQTQITRVALYYKEWLRQFPTFAALAQASTADVLRAWSGLGYNSRALRFHRLATEVVTRFHSRLPRDPVTLCTLPGIGTYTAHAVACFAFGARVPVVDVNIRRILTRWTVVVRSADEQIAEKEAWERAEQFLPAKEFFEWNQALMDLGGMICTAKNPLCSECPAARWCASAFSPSLTRRLDSMKKSEPQWRGTPRRLLRGRMLKALHHHALTAEELAAMLWNDAGRDDVQWVKDVLAMMCADGLLSQRGARFSLTA